jgi:threonine synthase
MGLPIKMICATNANDIVYRTLMNGDFSVNPAVIQTLAPAMDIQVFYYN